MYSEIWTCIEMPSSIKNREIEERKIDYIALVGSLLDIILLKMSAIFMYCFYYNLCSQNY